MRHTFVHSLILCFGLVLLALPAQSQYQPQDVWTWHYDNNRTGWQRSESSLTPSSVLHNGFMRLFQFTNITGEIFAQPLALYQVSNMKNCGTCNVVFIATEKDWLYAFNADSNTPLWSLDLANASWPGGAYVDCSLGIQPCEIGVLYPHIGVTGTPVIDRNNGNHIIYVVSLVHTQLGTPMVQYFLHAIDYLTGTELATPIQISATATGGAPSKCGTSTNNGTVTFNAYEHFQRTALLLLNGAVYVAFTPADGEFANGWVMKFTYHSGPPAFLHQDAVFNTTPHGTGGGIWMDGSGLAADSSNNIYFSTGNGSFDAGVPNPSNDYGDSLLQLDSGLNFVSYFTPSDTVVYPYPGSSGQARCLHDTDFGSGGVMIFPDSFVQGHPDLLMTADKETKLYLMDRDMLSGYNATGDNIIQELTTPTDGWPGEGYWSTPAYLEWGGTQVTHAIYLSVDSTDENRPSGNKPDPINMYILGTNVNPPPIPNSPNHSTGTKFCGHGGAPTVSSSGTTAATGIVWAYEDHDDDNPNDCNVTFGPAVLHGYDATDLSDVYTSPVSSDNGFPTKFSSPVVFHGKVYIGTRPDPINHPEDPSVVDVFGIP